MRPNYISTLWRRAWKDTWEPVVGFPLASILVTGVVAGLSIYIQHRPWNEMKEAILNLVVGITSSSIVFLVVFLFHFLLRTPKHLYAEAHARAEAVQTHPSLQNESGHRGQSDCANRLSVALQEPRGRNGTQPKFKNLRLLDKRQSIESGAC
jgi:hypothetical protein